MNTTLVRTRHIPSLFDVYIVGRADDLDNANPIDFGTSLAEKHIRMLESALLHWGEQKDEMESQGAEEGEKGFSEELSPKESGKEVQVVSK